MYPRPLAVVTLFPLRKEFSNFIRHNLISIYVWHILIFYSISFIKHRSQPIKLISQSTDWCLGACSLKNNTLVTLYSHTLGLSPCSFAWKKLAHPHSPLLPGYIIFYFTHHFPDPLRLVPPHLWSQSTPCFLTFTILDRNYTCASHLLRL